MKPELTTSPFFMVFLPEQVHGAPARPAGRSTPSEATESADLRVWRLCRHRTPLTALLMGPSNRMLERFPLLYPMQGHAGAESRSKCSVRRHARRWVERSVTSFAKS